jgi:hypothetical protein
VLAMLGAGRNFPIPPGCKYCARSSMKNSERSSIKSSEEDACAAVADAVVQLFDVELNREGRTLRAAENVFGVVQHALTMRIDEIERRERNRRG